MTAKGLNPRYLAYCRAQGRTPEDQKAHDEEAWPGGRNAGFILWMSEQHQAWAELNNFDRHGINFAMTMDGGGPFDQWLNERHP